MLDSECKVGAKVICTYDTNMARINEGKVGIITEVNRYTSGRVALYYINDLNGKPIHNPWYFLSCWTLYKEPTLECPCGIMRAVCIYHK